MNPTLDPAQMYSDRSKSYVRFVRLFLYPQGIRAYFLASSSLKSGLRVLDAGCGTGIVTLALRDAIQRRGLVPGSFHGFDLTPAMLEHFRDTLRSRDIRDVELVQADVLDLARLEPSWCEYDLIVSASMLEYLPPPLLSTGLRALRSRLKEGGTFLLFITRKNWLTRPLIGQWWESNLYSRQELEVAFREAGFASCTFRKFPIPFRHLALWGHIVEARV